MANNDIIQNLIPQSIEKTMRIIEAKVSDTTITEQIRAELYRDMFKRDSILMRAQASIISAETEGSSWMQRSWRPITMFVFLLMLFLYWIGLVPDYLETNTAAVDKVFGLLQVGIGGYIGSRGIEKVAQTFAQSGAFTKK